MQARDKAPSRGHGMCWFSGTALVVCQLVLSSPVSGQENQNGESKLTIDRLYSLPHLIGTAPGAPAWSPDGERVAFLWNDEGYNFRDVWLVDRDNPGVPPQRVTRMRRRQPITDSDDPVAIAQSQTSVDSDRGVSAVRWHPDGRQLLLDFRGDLWLVSPGSQPRRLTETAETETRVTYSPTGDHLAFMRNGDLWLMDARNPDSAPVRRTNVARSGVRLASFQWSPDGSQLAVLESDQRNVPVRGIPDYLSDETRMVEIRRSYPGEPAVKQRLGVLQTNGDEDIRWIDLSAGPGSSQPEMLLSYRWSPTGKQLAIDTSDLIAKDRKIFVAEIGDDRASTVRLIVREHEPLNETFYFWRIEWADDASMLYFLSDRDTDYHVWAVAPSATNPQPRQLTRGAWAVASMHPVPGGLIVVGNRGRAEERHLFFVTDNGREAVKISERPGTHSPTLSPNGRFAAVEFSSDDTPPELLITDLGDDRSERKVTDSPIDEFSAYRWATPQYVTFPSHIDGTILNGRLTLPPDFDSTRVYPAILGSVYTDAVRNQWGGRTAHPTWGLDQYLVQEGYVLLNVDMRGSWGRGRDHRRGIRLDYGGMDIEDLESGVKFLEQLGFVDMERVGIWGSSYGGLMTTMSLFRKPGLYAAGVAGAPATSVWHALTGQMAVMLSPSDSPEEYKDSSPFMHAHGLEDPLMIIHGMRDRVVLYKDTITLVQRLIALGKNVDLVTLPNSGHGWDNENLPQTRFAFNKMVEFFNRHLK